MLIHKKITKYAGQSTLYSYEKNIIYFDYFVVKHPAFRGISEELCQRYSYR